FGDAGGFGQRAGGGAVEAPVGKDAPYRMDNRLAALGGGKLEVGQHESTRSPKRRARQTSVVSIYSLTKKVNWSQLDRSLRQAESASPRRQPRPSRVLPARPWLASRARVAARARRGAA